MADIIKKQGLASYLNVIACIVAIVGLVTLTICSTMEEAYALNSFTLLFAGGVTGIALILFAIFASNRWGNYDYASTISLAAAVAIFTVIIGNVINNRILLISGLFSFNAGNKLGWSVFYVTVISLVCFLIAILLMIVGAFMRTTKE